MPVRERFDLFLGGIGQIPQSGLNRSTEDLLFEDLPLVAEPDGVLLISMTSGSDPLSNCLGSIFLRRLKVIEFLVESERFVFVESALASASSWLGALGPSGRKGLERQSRLIRMVNGSLGDFADSAAMTNVFSV